MNHPLPQFVRARMKACANCPKATKGFGAVPGVTLGDTCTLVGDDRQFVALVGDPDFRCPAGKFPSAIIGGDEVQGVVVVEGGRIVGFTPMRFRQVSQQRGVAKIGGSMFRPTGSGSCADCAQKVNHDNTGGMTL